MAKICVDVEIYTQSRVRLNRLKHLTQWSWRSAPNTLSTAEIYALTIHLSSQSEWMWTPIRFNVIWPFTNRHNVLSIRFGIFFVLSNVITDNINCVCTWNQSITVHRSPCANHFFRVGALLRVKLSLLILRSIAHVNPVETHQSK